jgi:hypothetical protein
MTDTATAATRHARSAAPAPAPALLAVASSAADTRRLTLARATAGAGPVAGVFPDARFECAYSFRVGGAAFGGEGTPAIVGAVGAGSAAGAVAAVASAGGHAAGSSYVVDLALGGGSSGSPALRVSRLGEAAGAAAAMVGGYAPDRPLNALYVVLTPPSNARMEIGSVTLGGASPIRAAGCGAVRNASHALYTCDGDLRDAALAFDLAIEWGGGAPTAPTLELYGGRLPRWAVCDHPPVAITQTGLAAIAALLRRQREG